MIKIDEIPIDSREKELLKRLEEQLNNPEVSIGFFGAFSVGKSELINTLLDNEGLLPTHANEATAVSTQIKFNEEESITAYYGGGEYSELNKDEFYSITAGTNINNVNKFIINLNHPSWLANLTIIDTPGRNTKFTEHIEASEQALTETDAVIYVINFTGLSLEDLVYIRHIIMYQPNIYFILNKVDYVNENQGETIDDLINKTKNELEQEFKQSFSVYATSAFTGYNMEVLKEEVILNVKKKSLELKSKRFKYAANEVFTEQLEMIARKIDLYKSSLKDDDEYNKKKSEVVITLKNTEDEIEDQFSHILEKFDEVETEIKNDTSNYYKVLSDKLFSLAISEQEIQKLQLQIEHSLLKTRNEFTNRVRSSIGQIIKSDDEIQLNEIKSNDINLDIHELDLRKIDHQYELEKERKLNKIASISNQIDAIPEGESEEEKLSKIQLKEELNVLTSEMAEQYTPQYVHDEDFDPNKAQKILKGFGKVLDIGIVLAASVMSAGSAGAAKAGASVTAKTAATTTAKTAATTTAKTAAKKARQIAMNKTVHEKIIEVALDRIQKDGGVQKKDSDSNDKPNHEERDLPVHAQLLTGLNSLLSPAETIASNIGRSVDGNRSANKSEDMFYRRQFFSEKQLKEKELNRKLAELNEIERKQKENFHTKKQLEEKREILERRYSQEIKELEDRYREKVEKAKKDKYRQEVSRNIEQIIEDEKYTLSLWSEHLLEGLRLRIESSIPHKLVSNRDKLRAELEELDNVRKNNKNDISETLKTLEDQSEKISSLLEDVTHV